MTRKTKTMTLRLSVLEKLQSQSSNKSLGVRNAIEFALENPQSMAQAMLRRVTRPIEDITDPPVEVCFNLSGDTSEKLTTLMAKTKLPLGHTVELAVESLIPG